MQTMHVYWQLSKPQKDKGKYFNKKYYFEADVNGDHLCCLFLDAYASQESTLSVTEWQRWISGISKSSGISKDIRDIKGAQTCQGIYSDMIRYVQI